MSEPERTIVATAGGTGWTGGRTAPPPAASPHDDRGAALLDAALPALALAARAGVDARARTEFLARREALLGAATAAMVAVAPQSAAAATALVRLALDKAATGALTATDRTILRALLSGERLADPALAPLAGACAALGVPLPVATPDDDAPLPPLHDAGDPLGTVPTTAARHGTIGWIAALAVVLLGYIMLRLILAAGDASAVRAIDMAVAAVGR